MTRTLMGDPGVPNIVERAQEQLDTAAQEDAEEIVNLIEDIGDAIKAKDLEKARQHRDALDDLLFYLDS